LKSIYFAHFVAPRGLKEPQKSHRINNEIKVPEVRVIDAEGEMLGVMKTRDAIKLAEQKELDLVEVAPKAEPPVCKIIDFGKFAYELQKKDKLQKRNQVQQQMKEVRFKWRTDTHDFNFKARHARAFLEEGNKVKASVMFRGREITHQEIGKELLMRFIEELQDIAKVDVLPKMEGRNLSVILSPDPTKVKKKK
jgi:translation initiation factor IF-3